MGSSCSVLYFIFLTRTRAVAFSSAILQGGAKYFATKRAAFSEHLPFHELLMSFAHSHWYAACDLLIVIGTGKFYTTRTDWNFLTWSMLLIASCWLITPFLFNP